MNTRARLGVAIEAGVIPLSGARDLTETHDLIAALFVAAITGARLPSAPPGARPRATGGTDAASDLAAGLAARLAAAGIPVRAKAADRILSGNGFEEIMLLAALARQVTGRVAGSLALNVEKEDSGAAQYV